MSFGGRLFLFVICLGITWYFNSEKARFNKLQEKAYVDENERDIGQYGVKSNFYASAEAVMFFVLIVVFIFLITGSW